METYAATRSSGRTTEAPIALDGTGMMGESMPMARAVSMTAGMPSWRPSCTATGLRDRASASRIVMRPRKARSALSGR